ncbi:uroporphyrinogen-III synthase [Oceanobacillus polygoni]|uniref:Uroporphyrinogen-III synthase n=1 Tax=Oceanobacillus polygoni TaxID=1235259 RepID=A0A9X0YUW5_9BACI|nr:uroporphyrinogen-III synthase [Oceanobacillus polygoni]MBP2077431.1 uroporphyrinogen-III synthase [Oceanobacillus polygoni]
MEESLHESKILITREASQAEEFSKKVRELGGIPIEVPLLAISCKDEQSAKYTFSKMDDFRWIFFTSANGVHCFFSLAEKYNRKQLQHHRLAVVGHKTDLALKKYGYQADFIPNVYHAEAMAEEFLQQFPNEGPILLIRGNRSRDTLPEEFTKHNVPHDLLEVYDTGYNYEMKDRLNELLTGDAIDFITFTSPSTVEAFVEMANTIPKKNYVCIGTTTEQRATALGIQSLNPPKEFTVEAMLETICTYIKKG